MAVGSEDVLQWAEAVVALALDLVMVASPLHTARGVCGVMGDELEALSRDLARSSPSPQLPDGRIGRMRAHQSRLIDAVNEARAYSSHAMMLTVEHAKNRRRSTPISDYPKAWLDGVSIVQQMHEASGFPKSTDVRAEDLALLVAYLARLEAFFDFARLEVRGTSAGWLFGVQLIQRADPSTRGQWEALDLAKSLFHDCELSHRHGRDGRLRIRFSGVSG